MKDSDFDLRGKPIPDYLTVRRNMYRILVFTAIFAILFINIFKPFESYSWVEKFFTGGNTAFIYVVVSTIFVLIGVGVLGLSRAMMYRFIQRRSGISFLEYAVWIIVEIFLTSVVFTVCAVFIRDDLRWASDMDELEKIYNVLRMAILCTSCVVLLPYAVYWLYLSNEDKKKRLNEINNNNVNNVSGSNVESRDDSSTNVIPFMDEKGEMRLTVKLDNVIYIEASDNYVIIKCNNNGKISDFLLRNSLKKLSENLAATSIQRCHRSYLVNFNHVVSLRRRSGEMFLELDIPDAPDIPVSKTFSENTYQFFMKGQMGKI